MNFNEVSFFAFLALILTLRVILSWGVGRWLLVVASYFFYGVANPWYCLLLLVSTVVDFSVAPRVAAARDKRTRKAYLGVSLLVNLGLLGVFKYGDFTIRNLNTILTSLGIGDLPLPGFILPVGISFYTFQTLSYTIDVYRGTVKPTRDFAAFALYVAYFPQLVAGPIERADALLPQLQKKQQVPPQELALGFQRMLWGLTKKVVFADRLGVMVDQVYARSGEASAPELAVATVAFSFQLYLDFSAYADIAIGVARMMGVKLRENFRWPFLARNPSDFWNRWHISLTTWFGDYVFRPLVKVMPWKKVRSLICPIIVMTLVGLWHGAGWTFILFGFLSGIAVALYQTVRRISGRRRGLFGNYWWSPPLAVFMNFILVNLIMVFFRSPDLGTAVEICTNVVVGTWSWGGEYTPYLVLLIGLSALHVWRGVWMNERREVALPGPVRGAFWFAMVMLVLYGAVDTTERFIYFQF